MKENKDVSPTTYEVAIPQERQYIQYKHAPVPEVGSELASEDSGRWYAKHDNFKPLTSEERPAFIKKVYAIMICQLILTVIMCIISYVSLDYRQFQLDYTFVFFIALALGITIEIMIFCVPKVAWKVPYNYILVLLFTICEGYMISYLCSFVFNKYGDDGGFLVLMAATFTLAAVVGLTIYACKTKSDFTTKGAILFMACLSLFIFGIMSGVFYAQAVNLMYSVICAILFGLYIVYDTQLIVGGNTHQLTIDDYIIGSMIIYIDIIYLFANILMIIISCIK